MAKYYVTLVDNSDFYAESVHTFVTEAISVDSILDGFREKLDALPEGGNVKSYGIVLFRSTYDLGYYTITAISLDEWVAENTRFDNE